MEYENSNGRAGLITIPVEGAVTLIMWLGRDTDNAERFMVKKHAAAVMESG